MQELGRYTLKMKYNNSKESYYIIPFITYKVKVRKNLRCYYYKPDIFMLITV